MNTPDEAADRIGRPAHPRRRGQDRRRRRDPLARAAHHAGVLEQPRGDLAGDRQRGLVPYRRHRRDERTASSSITDRKKDIIINAYGKNIAPQPLEALLKSSPYIGTPVLIGDRRKFLVALIVPNFEKLQRDAAAMGVHAASPEALVADARVKAIYQGEIDRFNKSLDRQEKIRRFTLLPRDFSIDEDEITPSLKVKRKNIDKKYKDVIDSMYADETSKTSEERRADVLKRRQRRSASRAFSHRARRRARDPLVRSARREGEQVLVDGDDGVRRRSSMSSSARPTSSRSSSRRGSRASSSPAPTSASSRRRLRRNRRRSTRASASRRSIASRNCRRSRSPRSTVRVSAAAASSRSAATGASCPTIRKPRSAFPK